MTFRAFGFPIQVQPFFLVVAVLFGVYHHGGLEGLGLPKTVIWVFLMGFGITVHELGHAFAMRRYRLDPEIVLHGFGGYTTAPGLAGLGRLQHVIVSAAGPAAGAALGALFYGLYRLTLPYLPAMGPKGMEIAFAAFGDAFFINIGWTILNLIPVVPLDGGHIVQHTLGPKRVKITLYISIVVALLIVAAGLKFDQLFLVVMFGSFGFGAYRQLSEVDTTVAVRRDPPKKKAEAEDPVPPELVSQLQKARVALEAERYDEAGTVAELILSEKPPKSVEQKALTIIGWAHLLEGRPAEAKRVVQVLGRKGKPDPGLVGAILFEEGRMDEAREVFQAARAEGNDDKAVVGPLIQILIQDGEIAKAAAIALDIVETLSDEDTRQMASIAADAEAHSWASRLYEALFDRSGDADDAYEAARQRGLEGDVEGARVLLQRAVSAGFSDAARAWSDKALSALRDVDEGDSLEALLPRQSH